MILQVLKEGHSKLRAKAKPADPTKAHHRTLARRMFETMRAHEALGIAANQVFPGELVRIIVVKTAEFTGIMFNPEIIEILPGVSSITEGCLSLKQKYVKNRPNDIFVKFTTIGGDKLLMNFRDLSAHVVQHEIDHLNGILISD